MTKYFGTVITAMIIIAAIVMAFLTGDMSMTPVQNEALRTLVIICSCSALYCFVVGQLTGNYSQMDKLWSILPIAYAWVIASKSGMKSSLVIYALVVTAWGIRLTINFARKGAYSIRFWEGREDYRWSIVHASPLFRSNFAWVLFNLFFISIYQNALVLAICLPAWAAMSSEAAASAVQIAGLIAAVLFLTLETVADEYQWNYHQRKAQLLGEGGKLEEFPYPYCLGFNVSGPWGRMRHPNYLGEQGIWLSLYFFAMGTKLHWTITGPLLLILLFMGSSSLGEAISSKKYPRYADYICQVRKYVPIRKFKA